MEVTTVDTIRHLAATGYSNKDIARSTGYELKYVQNAAIGARQKTILTDEDAGLIVELYKDLPIRKIAEKFDVTQKVISNLLKSKGVTIRGGNIKKITKYMKANKKATNATVADLFGVSVGYVCVIKSKAGLSKKKAPRLTDKSFNEVKDVDRLRLEGNSMVEACAIVGITVNVYYGRKYKMSGGNN